MTIQTGATTEVLQWQPNITSNFLQIPITSLHPQPLLQVRHSHSRKHKYKAMDSHANEIHDGYCPPTPAPQSKFSTFGFMSMMVSISVTVANVLNSINNNNNNNDNNDNNANNNDNNNNNNSPVAGGGGGMDEPMTATVNFNTVQQGNAGGDIGEDGVPVLAGNSGGNTQPTNSVTFNGRKLRHKSLLHRVHVQMLKPLLFNGFNKVNLFFEPNIHYANESKSYKTNNSKPFTKKSNSISKPNHTPCNCNLTCKNTFTRLGIQFVNEILQRNLHSINDSSYNIARMIFRSLLMKISKHK